MSLKRKLVDGAQQQLSMQKRRRDAEDSVVDGFDGGQGAKHWTDEEKSKLFNWLMGPGQDDHWNSLRATKNSCLREVSRPSLPLSISLTRSSARSKCSAARRLTRHLKAATNATLIYSSRSTRSSRGILTSSTAASYPSMA